MFTCFCCGHRDTPEAIYPLLFKAVCTLMEQHKVIDFLVGHRGNFDQLAARAVKEAKKRYPQARLTLLLSHLPPTPLSSGFDDSLYPEGLETVPKRLAICRANQLAVVTCDCLLCYICHSPSNTGKLLPYAQGRGIPVYNLAHEEDL